MPSTHEVKFRKLLGELFMFDQADLDFGIYRIMNAKRSEISRFLDQDLLPQVRQVLGEAQGVDQQHLREELAKAEAGARALGVKPDDSPKVQELRARLAATGDLDKLEGEVFSHLYTFFRRYYDQGDFISQRRYKEGVYAIPYEGEEVKLYWANHDQYYVKTTEHFRDFAFKLPEDLSGDLAELAGHRVHFKLTEADTERDNNQANGNGERRFVLDDEQPMLVEGGELILRFAYRPMPKGTKQDDLNRQAVETVLGKWAARGDEPSLFDEPDDVADELRPWRRALAVKQPTDSNPDRTLLAKRLAEYTARNTFDYFIHKDLGGFLKQELDFYLKSEVMHLDDLDDAGPDTVESYLATLKAIRRIGHKIIAFLHQLEEFQKRLWLKKKFVVETQYCLTLDRVPEAFYPEIAANEAQRQAWVGLFAIDEIEATLEQPAYSEPLTVEFLKAQPYLVLDTRHFSREFTERLIAELEGLEDATDGLAWHSENFQALETMQRRYRERVRCIYIDPPYNTGGDGFPYKDGYRHSSWLSMLEDRLTSALPMMDPLAGLLCSVDDNEQVRLVQLLASVLGEVNGITSMVWEGGRKNDSKQVSVSHEYVVAFGRDLQAANQANARWRQRKDGVDAIYKQVTKLLRTHGSDYAAASQALWEWYDSLRDNDPAKKQKRYRWLDPRASERGPYFADKIAGPDDGRLSRPRDEVLHPVTNKPVKLPKTGWCWSDIHQKVADDLVHFGEDETTVPCKKTYLRDTEFEAPHSVFYKDGRGATLLLASMLPDAAQFNPKDVEVIGRLVNAVSDERATALDFFAGSGTTAHAVINLNREDDGHRKYILVEMGAYFDTVLLPRIQKVVYSDEWKDGKPVSRQGSSHLLKVLRLESYEDALNNLRLHRTEAQARLIETDDQLREEYLLGYVLDLETRGSPSLLDVKQFTNPFAYQLNIATDSVGETRPVNVDLVETFNWLLGLRVKHLGARVHRTAEFERDEHGKLRVSGRTRACEAGPSTGSGQAQGWTFRPVEGVSPEGDRVLVIWRTLRGDLEQDNAMLDAMMEVLDYNPRDLEFDLIYVNGDNNLENLRRDEDTWKVNLIEPTFGRLMFDVKDV